MELETIYDRLSNAKRPIEFFGDVSTGEDIHKKYREFAKKVHPDLNKGKSVLASKAFDLLGKVYLLAQDEYKKGIYNLVDPVEIYKRKTPLFEFEQYKFYEHAFDGEVANVFKGIDNKDIVYLKVAKNPDDNEFLENEFEVLSTLRHKNKMIPIAKKKLIVNDSLAIIMNEVEGIPMPEFIKLPKLLRRYPNGIPDEHVLWMVERLFNVLEYLHDNKVIHGNIKPENILINNDNHKVSLVGFSFCIPNGNSPTARYKILNKDYTAPEVDRKAEVCPSSDIFSVGKVAIELLGGNIQTNKMPDTVHPKVQNFINRLINEKPSKRPDNAWELWGEVSDLRTNIFGEKRYKSLI